MRDRVEPLVRRWWEGGGGVGGRILRALTLPTALLYRGGLAVRNRAFDHGILRTHRVPVPVISVGNLVVGGTGKTPVSAWLVRELGRAGRTPGLVARGYGVDELRLHRRWNPEAPVRAHPDRVRAARAAAADGADAVVLDDGFQHRRLGRDLDVVLLAAETPFPGRVLPRGPYREPPAALHRAQAVLVTRRTAAAAEALALADRVRRGWSHTVVGIVTLAPAGWTDLDGRPADAPRGGLLAVSSVAAPAPFHRMVESITGVRPRALAFPDHHDFTPADVAGIGRAAGDATVVTTEKDAVKLERFAGGLPAVRVLALRVEPGPGADRVLDRVLRAATAGGTALPGNRGADGRGLPGHPPVDDIVRRVGRRSDGPGPSTGALEDTTTPPEPGVRDAP